MQFGGCSKSLGSAHKMVYKSWSFVVIERIKGHFEMESPLKVSGYLRVFQPSKYIVAPYTYFL